MNWINDVVRPKIGNMFSRRDTPDNLWQRCDECGSMLFHREVKESLYTCPNCNHHMAISPQERLNALFDGGIYSPIEIPQPIEDPLKFRDQKRYIDRLKDARKKTGDDDAMIVAEGHIDKLPVTVAVQNFGFMGGSMGMFVGNAIVAGIEHAIARGTPFVLYSAAGGARMQEGILSLMQMPRTTVAIQMLREANLPYIVVLTHPTTGGVTASYAMLGDIQIAEPGALICFAGPRVIEQTIGETLPEGFQRAEYLLEHGMLDSVTHRLKQREELSILLRMLLKKPPRVVGELETPKPEADEQNPAAESTQSV